MNAPAPWTPKQRGLVFTGDNVRAILDDAKTQTRRIIRDDWWRCLDPEDPDDLKAAIRQCPYGQPGDVLYVREIIKVEPCTQRLATGVLQGIGVHYKASPNAGILFIPSVCIQREWRIPKQPNRWQSARFMPKWAARTRLEITRVRIQRIQQISKADQRAEGYGYIWGGDCKHLSFPSRWNETNGDRGSWNSNPWVFALTFRRLIDVQI